MEETHFTSEKHLSFRERNIKRSAPARPRVAKAHFIAEGCFISETSSCAARRTSLGAAVIILPNSSHNELRQTSFKKRTFVGRQKCVILCERATKRCISGGKYDQKYGIHPFDKLEFVTN